MTLNTPDRGKSVHLDEATSARLREVRKELGKGGLLGLFGGAVVGTFGFTAYPYMFKPVKNSKNNFLATLLISASIGSFIGAVVFGKNAAQYVGDIFRINNNSTSTYQNQLHKNEKDVVDAMDEAFERRAEAIKRAKELKGRLE